MEQKFVIQAGKDPIEIRTGAALPNPEPVRIAGLTLNGPFNYAIGRNLDAKTSLVLVKNTWSDYRIELRIHEGTPMSGHVIGEGKIHPDFLEWKINTTFRYTHRELLNFIRLRRSSFEHLRSYDTLIAWLSNFEVEVSTKIKDTDSRKGEREMSKELKAQGLAKMMREAMIDRFTVSLPLIAGGSKRTFGIELLVEVLDSGVMFYLESIDVNDFIKTEFEEQLSMNITGFNELEIPVVYLV